jgi:hypothetical protein
VCGQPQFQGPELVYLVCLVLSPHNMSCTCIRLKGMVPCILIQYISFLLLFYFSSSLMYINTDNDGALQLDQYTINLEQQGRTLTPLTPVCTEALVCVICLDPLHEQCRDMYTCTTTNCPSVYCTQCVRQWIAISKPQTCALCKASCTLMLIYPQIIAWQGSGVHPEQHVRVLLASSTEASERPSNALATTRGSTHHAGLGYLLLVSIGIILHILLHIAIGLRLDSCLGLVIQDAPTFVSHSHNQQDVCRASLVICIVLGYVHAMTAVLIWVCGLELIFCYGIFSISIWVARINVFVLTLSFQLRNNEDGPIAWTIVLFSASIVSGLFDLVCCLVGSIHNTA